MTIKSSQVINAKDCVEAHVQGESFDAHIIQLYAIMIILD